MPLTEVTLRGCHGPSTARPALEDELRKKPAASVGMTEQREFFYAYPALYFTRFVALRVRPEGLTYDCDAPPALKERRPRKKHRGRYVRRGQDGEMNSPLQDAGTTVSCPYKGEDARRAQHAAPLQPQDAAFGLDAPFLCQGELKQRTPEFPVRDIMVAAHIDGGEAARLPRSLRSAASARRRAQEKAGRFGRDDRARGAGKSTTG